MKALSDVKLKYLIDKIKSLFSPKDHTHESVPYAEAAGTATVSDKTNQKVLVFTDLSKTSLTKDDCKEMSDHKMVIGGVKNTLPPGLGGTGMSFDSVEALKAYFGGSNVIVKPYTGDGSYGKDNPNTLEVPFFPKLMIIRHAGTDCVNIIPFDYYPADDEYPEESSFDNVYVCGGNSYTFATISGEYSEGILSWYCNTSQELYTSVDLDTGVISRKTRTMSNTDNKAFYQQNHDGAEYWCYIFG